MWLPPGSPPHAVPDYRLRRPDRRCPRAIGSRARHMPCRAMCMLLGPSMRWLSRCHQASHKHRLGVPTHPAPTLYACNGRLPRDWSYSIAFIVGCLALCYFRIRLPRKSKCRSFTRSGVHRPKATPATVVAPVALPMPTASPRSPRPPRSPAPLARPLRNGSSSPHFSPDARWAPSTDDVDLGTKLRTVRYTTTRYKN